MSKLPWEHWNVRIKTVWISRYYDDETVIEFNQWTSTDRANLISCSENVPQFKNLVIQQLEKLTAHSFIAKCQSIYLREFKENLEENKLLFLVKL